MSHARHLGLISLTDRSSARQEAFAGCVHPVVRTLTATRWSCQQRKSPDCDSPGWPAYSACYNLGVRSNRYPSEAEYAGALLADTTRKGEFAMRDTWT
jgi:hypothetical protein